MTTWLRGTIPSTQRTPDSDPVEQLAQILRNISHKDMRRLSTIMSEIAQNNIGCKLDSSETEYVTDYDMQEILYDFADNHPR